MVLHMEDVSVSFDGFKAINDLNFYVNAGELRCVIGPNGAGKTTLFNAITGDFPPTMGRVRLFGEDVTDRRIVERKLLGLCEGVAAALRRKKLAGTTVTVKLRFEGFETITRRRTLEAPVDTFEHLWPAARQLFREADRPKQKVRLIGVTVSGFERAPSQLGLFEAPGPDLDHRVAEVVDRLSERYGRGTVTRAAMLEEKPKS